MEMEQGYKISTSEKHGIVEMILTGEVTKDSIDEMMKSIYGIVVSLSPGKLLVDVRELTGRFGYTEAYFRIQQYPSSFRSIKHAVVDRKEHEEYRSFQEYVAVNSGFDFKWFTDIEIARQWLKSNPAGDERPCP